MMVTLGANDKQFIEGRTVCPTPGLLVRFWSGARVARQAQTERDEQSKLRGAECRSTKMPVIHRLKLVKSPRAQTCARL